MIQNTYNDSINAGVRWNQWNDEIYCRCTCQDKIFLDKAKTTIAAMFGKHAYSKKQTQYLSDVMFTAWFNNSQKLRKNYLDEKERKVLNNIVSGYFDFAEIQAMRHNPMYMSDYVDHLDNVLKATGEDVLEGAGKISHAQAMAKANEEYQKFQVKNLSQVIGSMIEEHKVISELLRKDFDQQKRREPCQKRKNDKNHKNSDFSLDEILGGG